MSVQEVGERVVSIGQTGAWSVEPTLRIVFEAVGLTYAMGVVL